MEDFLPSVFSPEICPKGALSLPKRETFFKPGPPLENPKFGPNEDPKIVKPPNSSFSTL